MGKSECKGKRQSNKRTAKKKAFLEELRQRYSVYHACLAAKVGRTTVYEWRDEDPAFAAAWEEALEDAMDALEASVYERAMEGDTTLSIFVLKGGKPDRYKERTSTELTGAGGKDLRVEFVSPEKPGEAGGA